MTSADKKIVRNLIIFCIIFSIFFTIYRVMALLNEKEKQSEKKDPMLEVKIEDSLLNSIDLNDNSSVNPALHSLEVEGIANPYDNLDNLLYEAINKGSLEETRRYIDMGANINAKNAEGYSILSRITGNKNLTKDQITCLRYLLIKGADTNSQNKNGDTALINHLNKGYFDKDILNLLFEYGANPNIQNNEGTAPVSISSSATAEAVKYLLDHGANINIKNLKGETPLYLATKAPANYPVVELLLQQGADRNMADNKGVTPLDIAKASKDKDLISIYNLTPEDVETDSQLKKLQKLLADNINKAGVKEIKEAVDKGGISNGIKVTKIGNKSVGEYPTPLTIAIRFGYNDIAKSLIDNGADINKPDEYPRHSPLMIASSNDNIEIMEYLINKGANLNYESSIDNTTALNFANNPRTAEVLLKAGIEPNTSGNAGCISPLQKAVMSDNVELASTLIKYGADVNHVDCGIGKPILVNAIDNNNPVMVKLLLDNGAGVNTESDASLTKKIPDYAKEKGNKEVIDLITSKKDGNKGINNLAPVMEDTTSLQENQGSAISQQENDEIDAQILKMEEEKKKNQTLVNKMPVNQIPVNNTAPNQTPLEQKPVNQAPVNQIPADQMPVNNTTPSQTPLEQKPVNQAPVNQIPANQMPVNNTTPSQTPLEQKPVNQTPVNQIPADQMPVNNTTPSQTPLEQKPVNQTPVNQIPANQMPVNNTTPSQTPLEQKPVNQTPVNPSTALNNAQNQIPAKTPYSTPPKPQTNISNNPEMSKQFNELYKNIQQDMQNKALNTIMGDNQEGNSAESTLLNSNKPQVPPRNQEINNIMNSLVDGM